MADPIEELLVGLGFDYDDEAAEQYEDAIDSILDSLRNFVLGISAAAGATFLLAQRIASTSDELLKTATDIGTTSDQLHGLRYAAQLAGLDASTADNVLRTLDKTVVDLAHGSSQAAEAMALLGVNTRDQYGKAKPLLDLLPEISTALEGMSRERQVYIAEQLGLREALPLLKQGGEALTGFIAEAKRLNNITRKDSEMAAEFNDEWLRVTTALSGVGTEIGRTLLPMLTDLFVSMQDGLLILQSWLVKGRELVVQWGGWEVVLSDLSLVLAGLLTPMLIRRMIMFIGFIRKGAAFIGALRVVALALSGALAAAATAVVLIGEDLYRYFNGAPSLVGELVDKFPLLGAVLENARLILKSFYNVIVGFGELWLDVNGRILSSMSGMFDTVYNMFPEHFAAMGEVVDKFFGEILNVAGRTDWAEALLAHSEKFRDFLRNLPDEVEKAFRSLGVKIADNLRQLLQDAINTISKIPLVGELLVEQPEQRPNNTPYATSDVPESTQPTKIIKAVDPDVPDSIVPINNTVNTSEQIENITRNITEVVDNVVPITEKVVERVVEITNEKVLPVTERVTDNVVSFPVQENNNQQPVTQPTQQPELVDSLIESVIKPVVNVTMPEAARSTDNMLQKPNEINTITERFVERVSEPMAKQAQMTQTVAPQKVVVVTQQDGGSSGTSDSRKAVVNQTNHYTISGVETSKLLEQLREEEERRLEELNEELNSAVGI